MRVYDEAGLLLGLGEAVAGRVIPRRVFVFDP
jgi:hypothetical protein